MLAESILATLSIETITVFITGLSAFALAIWRVSKVESHIVERITKVEHESEIERSRLKEELLQARIALSDTYVHKDSFDAAMKNIDARLIRLEAKLDRVLDKAH